jgi:hypothetical protein
MARGIVIFYVNVNPEHLEAVKPQELIDMTRENHVETITSLKEDGWDIMFMPCIGEASRVEKVNLLEDSDSDD